MKRILKTMAFVMLLTIVLSLTVSAASNYGTHLSGSNEYHNNYSTYGDVVKSYMTVKGDKLMTVSSTDYGIEVAYYYTDYRLYKTKAIKEELPIFGGFYETENNYYILSGQNNPNEQANVEVYRLTKYDKSWKRLGAVGLYNCNTTIPFDAGSARFAHSGNVLVVRTCHEMYKSADGLNHQANLTFSVNTDTMSIITSQTYVWNISVGYVSHSFNQFIEYDGSRFVAVDHGDAHPRNIGLVKFSTNSFKSDTTGVNEAYSMLDIPGATGDNYTGVSIGAFEVSPNAYLVAGNSAFQSGQSSSRDVFVSALPRNGTAATVNYVKGYTGAGTPHMVKLSDSYYLLMWTMGDYVYYVRVDINGNLYGSVKKMKGVLSDCVPVVINNKVQWYTYNNDKVTFYAIKTDLSATSKKVTDNGHEFKKKSNSSYHWLQCTSCSRTLNKQAHHNKPSTTYLGFDAKGNWVRACMECDYAFKSNPVTVDAVVSKDQYGDEDLSLVIKTPSRTLKEGTDYRWYMSGASYTYDSNWNKVYMSMTASVHSAAYFGQSFEKKFLSLEYYGTIGDIKTQTYTGRPVKPAVKVKVDGKTLKSGTDYTVSYKNNTKVGTATVTVTGKGSYFGTLTKTFYVGYSVSTAKVTGLQTKTHTGKALTQNPKVVVKGKTLKKGVDYTISYKNNVSAGKATIKISGKGKYTGSISKTFTIKPASISKCKITLSSKTVTHNGKKIAPSVIVKNPSGKTLKRGVHYTLTYHGACKNVGTYKVTVKMISGSLKGSKTLTFKITPPKTSVTAATAGKTSMKLTWKKQTKQVSGYEIQYGTTKSVNAPVKTITKYATANTTLKGLKPNKTYYIRLRTYKTVNGKKVYSEWTKYKPVKTKA